MMLRRTTDRDPTNPAVPTASPRARYRYRGGAERKRDTPDSFAIDLEKDLQRTRQMLSQAVADFRAINARQRQQIAEAVCDGVAVRMVAEAASINMTQVRSTALAFDESWPAGTSRETHLGAIKSTREELRHAEARKSKFKDERDQLILKAHKLRLYDHFQIASITGMTAEEIRRQTRGTRASTQKR